MKNPHDLFMVTVGIWLRVNDIYSFNNMYASTPFECIKQHFGYCESETGVLDKAQMSRKEWKVINMGNRWWERT